MKKALFILMALLVLFMTACVPINVDREIKDIIKSVPVPDRYDPHTGEKLSPGRIVVKDADKDGDDFSYYDGSDTRYFYVMMRMDGHWMYLDYNDTTTFITWDYASSFFDDSNNGTISSSGNYTYSFSGYDTSYSFGWCHYLPPRLTLTEIREHKEALEWVD